MIDFPALITGIHDVLNIAGIGWMVFGVAFGIICGAIPGFTSPMALVVLIPVSYVLTPLRAMILMTACYAGSIYGGSITAILINAPGTPASACTTFDGYQMTKKGYSNEALGIALSASVIGGLLSYACLLLLMKPISILALKFGSAEMFMLAIFGLTIISSLQSEELLKGILAGLLGLLIGTIGMAPTGGLRGTFYNAYLIDGISFIPALIGLFAFTELMVLIEREYVQVSNENRKKATFSLKKIFKGIKETLNYPGTILKSSIIGIIVGAIPAAGGSIANFLAYNQTKQFSQHPETFGTGDPEGVVAAETANNASTGGALITTLAIGIPGGVSAAVILGALILHGLIPGPRLFLDQMPLIYGLTFAIILSQFVMLWQGLFFSWALSHVIEIPTKILVPSIALLCIVGTYTIRNSIFDVFIMVIFGIIGLFMRKYGYPAIAIVLGIVLGPIADEQLIQTSMRYGGDLSVLFTRPISLGLFILTISSMLIPVYIRRKRKRKE